MCCWLQISLSPAWANSAPEIHYLDLRGQFEARKQRANEKKGEKLRKRKGKEWRGENALSRNKRLVTALQLKGCGRCMAAGGLGTC